MGDFVAYPSRWRIALMILGALAFVAMGAWMLGMFGSPPDSGRYSPETIQLIGWAAVLFFGLCAIAGVRRLFATGEELRIGAAGIRWVRWSDKTVPWDQITDVTVWRYRRQKMIILHLRDPGRYPGRGIAGMAAGANRGLTGGDIAISLSAMDRSFDEAMTAIARFTR